MRDTIFALSTVFGKSGIAVIRIAGPNALLVPPLLGVQTKLIHKNAVHAKLWDLKKSNILDEVVILPFLSPNSFNGEDIVELHIHGSIAVINDVLSELEKIEFLRMSEPGEFTKIAFYNGKIDLTKAEGLADLLEAETSLQRNIAQKHLFGELEDLYEKWRKQLVYILSQLEAFIDFPEDDIPTDTLKITEQLVKQLAQDITTHLQYSERSEKIMHGIRIVISGAPNVGKSSLLNLISQKDIAIVSNIAGTTRDVVQIKINLEGFPIILMDTAGIRSETKDIIEIEGIKRAKAAIKGAGINIIIFDNNSEIELIKEYNNQSNIIVINKIDLLSQKEIEDKIKKIAKAINVMEENIIAISTKDQINIDALLNRILIVTQREFGEFVDKPAITRLRQQNRLKECLWHLDKFDLGLPLEIASQEIRLASDSIGRLSGRIHVEEILDEVFKNFCIGK